MNKQQRYNRIHAWLRSSGTLERLQQQTLQAMRECESTAASATSMGTNKDTTEQTIPHYKIQRYDTEQSVVVLSCASLRGFLGRAQAVAQQLEEIADATPSGTLHVSLSVPATVFRNTSCSSNGDVSATTTSTTDKVQSWWRNQHPDNKAASASSPTPPLTVRTVPAEESALDARVHQLYWDYQTKVHKDPHPLQEPDAMDIAEKEKDTNKETNCLADPRAWVMVQQTYGESPSRRIVAAVAQFWDFLVASPLLLRDDAAASTGNTNKTPSATYHQQYWMGDILIAVSVLDILANDGVSSVYCFYDPTFPYPLGSIAILYEITHYTRDALQLPWYYLGYYIESCPKMNYKGLYAPSQLLCRSTHTWVDLETVARPRLLANDTCVVFGDTTTHTKRTQDEGDSPTANSRPLHSIDGLRLSIHGTPCRFLQLPTEAQTELRPHVQQWMRNASEEVATRCVLDFRAGGADT